MAIAELSISIFPALCLVLFRSRLKLTQGAREWLGEKGYDPEFGARPMARLIDNALKKPLAEALLFGTLKDGGTAFAEVKPDREGLELTFATANA